MQVTMCMCGILLLVQEDVNLDVNVQKKWSYTVKVINPNGMGGKKFLPLDSHETFDRIQDIKECILTGCQEYIEKGKQLNFGYIKPGHGKKGKQIDLVSDDDLREMYPRYKKGTNILLWMKHSTITTTRKRARTPAGAKESERIHQSEPESSTSGGRKAGRSSYDKHIEKMTVVDEICDELSAKHGDKYTPEQYRCWANLIQLQKHDSYDSPPKKRFFGEKSGSTVPTQSVGAGVSPSKRITMRSECMSQLDKWHGLKERGIISEEQYKEVQDKIMSDIQKV